MTFDTSKLERAKDDSSQVVNLILQGKGGVENNLIAGFLAQVYTARNQAIKCIDTLIPSNGHSLNMSGSAPDIFD